MNACFKDRCCWICKPLEKCFLCCLTIWKYNCFCCFFLLAVFLAGMTFTASPSATIALLPELCLSRLQQWMTWFPIMFLMPCVGFLPVWCAERRAETRRLDREQRSQGV